MSLDSSLARLKVYAGTLDAEELKADLAAVLEWVAYARLLLGPVEPGQDYHVYRQNQRAQTSERYQSTFQQSGIQQGVFSQPVMPSAESAETSKEPVEDKKPAA